MTKKEKFIKEFIELQYELIGVNKDFQYAYDNEGWIEEYELSEQQKVQLWVAGFQAYRKRFKVAHNDAVKEFSDVYDAYSFSQENIPTNES